MQDIRTHFRYLEDVPSKPAREANSFLASLSHLKPFLRAVLVADGTVTLLLKAYFDEGMCIETMYQSSFVLEAPVPQLNLLDGDNAFFRQVDLVGSRTGKIYAQANSILNPVLLNPALFSALIKKDVGMGDVLRNSARGSYREILDIRFLDHEKIARTYTVTLDSVPAIMITEVFNSHLF